MVNSKQKGASYERKVCQQLSLWVTGGSIADGLWRSAMSGGRATVHLKRGTKIQQVGDIAAVRPELHAFTARYFVECKHVRSLDLEAFILSGKGSLSHFWRKALKESLEHARYPMIVARQNRTPDVVLTGYGVFPHEKYVPKASLKGGWDLWLLSELLRHSYVG